jgi:acetyl-CoA carboxylase biotin carboxylase subunit
VLTDSLRERMAAAALSLAKAVGYASLGTVEMLVDGEQFYLLEMNTRLQVEHTVTEMVTGLDLVEWQLRIAMDEPLPARQQDLRFSGHAIQCRICAEDPDKGFLPSPGQITRFLVPEGPGVRNDVGVVEGDFVTPHYDPMIAKLVVHGPDRRTTIERLRAALAAYVIEGVKTNLPMHRRIVEDPAFVAGDLSTAFLKERLGYKI